MKKRENNKYWKSKRIGFVILVILISQINCYSQFNFSVEGPITIGGNAYDITVGNFDNDGRLEAIVSHAQNYNNTTPSSLNIVSYLKYNVNTSVWERTIIENSGGYASLAITSGDYDSDGNEDFAFTANCNCGNYYLYKGDGADGFTNATPAFSGNRFSYDMISGEFNNDGKLDILTGGNTVLSKFLNTSTGTDNFSFNKASFIIHSSDNSSYGYSMSDFNGDGFNDIVAAVPAEAKVRVLLNDGAGGFNSAVYTDYSITGTSTSNIRGVATGDFNDDGYTDIVAASYNGNAIGVLINLADGTGTFGSVVLYSVSAPKWVEIGDLNNDGFLDVVVAANNISIFSGNGDGTFSATPYEFDLAGVNRLDVADADNDGFDDIFAITTNTFRVLLNILNDQDGDGFNQNVDCDDNNPDINPGALEVCDGVDNDCNGLIDSNDPGFVDNINPEAICHDTTLYLDASGNVSINAEDIDDGSNDDCGIENWTLNIDSFTCGNIGENIVELTVTDYSSNFSTCTATVTVEDTEAPVVNCSGTVGEAAYVSSITGEPWGETSNIDAMDLAFGAGNWEHLYYETVDANTLISNAYNFIYMDGGATNDIPMKTFVDANIGDLEAWVSAGGNLFLNAGPWNTSMNWGFGGVQLIYGSGTESGHVIATDPTHPIFTGPFTPVAMEYTGDSYSHAYIPEQLYTNVLISDYNDPAKFVLVSALWGQGKVFFGGMTSANFHEPELEAFNLRANMLSYLGASAPLEYALGENGTVSITVEDINGGSTDNCGIDTMYLDKYVFDCADVGENEVTLTVVDVNGNSASCTSTVTIVDDAAPSLKTKSIEVFLDENGEYTLTAEDVAKISEGTIDNCTAAEDLKIGAYPVDFSCVHVGKEPVVQVVAKDKSGNEAKAWVTITVSDTLAPAIAAVEDVEIETELCDTVVAIDYPEIVVDDNCDIEPELIAGLGAGAMFPVGITTETWVATDAAGNADTLSFDVIVTAGNDLPTLDSIADITADEDAEPVVIELDGISYGEDCKEQDLTISAGSLDATLVDSITVTYVTGDSTGTIEIALAPNMNGTTEITVTVEDEGGAEVSQTFMLTVAPVNDAPFVVMPVPDQTVYASYVLEIPVSSVLGELFNDVDDDELEVSVMVEGADSLPAWATMLGDTLVCEPMIADTGCVNIVVMATDTSGATASDTFEVCVDGYPTAVGGFDMENLEVQMYPNPTNGRVNIEISSGLHDIDLSVMDMTGRVVMQKQYSALEKVVFDMSGKVAGMYFVHMNIDGEQIIKKLIVDNK